MSKQVILTTQLVQSEESGKFRVLLSIIKDEWLELSCILTADQARDLGNSLEEMSRQARGKSIILPGGGSA
jgi:hypothetical protein